MEKRGCVIGQCGGQVLREVEVLEDLYGVKAKFDLTKTQNS